MTGRVAKFRKSRDNLEKLLPKFASKGRLAGELLPIFEQKLRRAQAQKTEHKIPVTTVLDRAVSLGVELPPWHRPHTTRAMRSGAGRHSRKD